MNEQSNGKKQAVALWILGVLIVILIAIIVGLFITQAKNKNQEVASKDAKIAQMEQELAQLKKQNENISNTTEKTTQSNENLTSEIAKKDETIRELEKQINELKKTESDKNSTIKYNTEDLNEEKEKVIRKLLLEQMPCFSFQESVSKEKYKVVGKYINSIEIYSESYVKTLINNDLDWYKNQIKHRDDLKADVVAIGTVSFTTEFNKEIEQSDVVFAGGSKSMMPYKNSMVQSFIFRLNKLENGEYKLELGTGW